MIELLFVYQSVGCVRIPDVVVKPVGASAEPGLIGAFRGSACIAIVNDQGDRRLFIIGRAVQANLYANLN